MRWPPCWLATAHHRMIIRSTHLVQLLGSIMLHLLGLQLQQQEHRIKMGRGAAGAGMGRAAWAPLGRRMDPASTHLVLHLCSTALHSIGSLGDGLLGGVHAG
jgi:hypothetical protein